jgi:NAD(P)-dependent dehydrogenase (short-subunit alcohol dehydrogenase family)
LTHPLDVRSPEAWEAVLARAQDDFGGLDTLINFAGLLIPAGVLDVTQRQIDAHVDVMVKGVMHGTAAAAKAFQAQRTPAHDGHGGHIVNVSSLGAVAPVSGVSLYQAAKAGCRTFSLAAAKDLADHGIAVSVLMPDAVATPMADLQLLYDESVSAAPLATFHSNPAALSPPRFRA